MYVFICTYICIYTYLVLILNNVNKFCSLATAAIKPATRQVVFQQQKTNKNHHQLSINSNQQQPQQLSQEDYKNKKKETLYMQVLPLHLLYHSPLCAHACTCVPIVLHWCVFRYACSRACIYACVIFLLPLQAQQVVANNRCDKNKCDGTTTRRVGNNTKQHCEM